MAKKEYNGGGTREAAATALKTMRDIMNGTIAPRSNTVFDCRDKLSAALAEPPRECDRFADENQADALHAAFIEYCNGCDCPMGCDHRKNPRFLLDGNCASIMKCFARFALSKATPKEGGTK